MRISMGRLLARGHRKASCFAGFGFSMNRSGASSAAWMRRQAMSKYFGSISMPMNRRPSFAAATRSRDRWGGS
jgi:hypothetical protein